MRDQDGYTNGTLQSFTIDATRHDRRLVHERHRRRRSDRSQLADFNNPEGLSRVGRQHVLGDVELRRTRLLGYAGEGSTSSIASGALEMSNVDLAQEFTDMIVAQRGFQANSRVITTSDQMMQELVQLKQ